MIFDNRKILSQYSYVTISILKGYSSLKWLLLFLKLEVLEVKFLVPRLQLSFFLLALPNKSK
ncbi:hypothetical protein GCM10022396_17390 [Flavivirga amylovorans]